MKRDRDSNPYFLLSVQVHMKMAEEKTKEKGSGLRVPDSLSETFLHVERYTWMMQSKGPGLQVPETILLKLKKSALVLLILFKFTVKMKKILPLPNL